MHSEFEDNSSLYDTSLNRFTRPQAPVANARLQKAVIRLAVIDATLRGTLPPTTKQTAMLHKGGVGGVSTKRDGYSYINEGYMRDYDQLQEQYQRALNGIVSKHKESR